MSMDNPELFLRIAVAFAVGLLIGLERGWSHRGLESGRRAAGFRTFGLVGGVGGIAAVLAETYGGAVLAVAVLAIGAITVAGYWRSTDHDKDLSVTTTVALLAAAGLGALAGMGQLAAAGAGAVVVTLLLSVKPEMHYLLTRIDRAELLATVRVLVISVVLLPLLPNEGFGPWQALNPFEIWWMVVLVAAISYVGYFAMKIAGTRQGSLITGLLGGLASSTAVTVSLARLAHERATARDALAAGIVGACSVMFLRMLVVVAILSPELALRLAWGLVPATAASVAAAAWLARRAGSGDIDGDGKVQPGNPLNLKLALQFGALLVGAQLAIHAMRAWAGDAGQIATAALFGIADVDAITLSLSAQASADSSAAAVSAAGIALAAAVNTVVKAGLTGVIGGRALAWPVGAALFVALGGGAAGLWWGHDLGGWIGRLWAVLGIPGVEFAA